MAVRILIAPDKFKHSLTAREVCDAVSEGLQSRLSDVHIATVELADGGEGTSSILTRLTGGTTVRISTCDPLNRQLNAAFGVSADGKTAILEAASASGLSLLSMPERNPLKTTSYGTGLMIRHAIELGVEHVIVGVGGTATNDGGMGIASALGYDFFDSSGNLLAPVGENMIHVSSIESRGVLKDLFNTRITVLTDVTNPFAGPRGAAFTYAKQKGASPDEIEQLDRGLSHLASAFQGSLLKDVLLLKGSGAGGGMAGGMVALLNANIERGIDTVMQYANLEEEIMKSEVVITGEGKLDNQSLMGKVIQGVSGLSRKHNKVLILVSGINLLTREQVNQLGARAVFSLVDLAPQDVAVKEAAQLLRQISATRIVEAIEQNAV